VNPKTIARAAIGGLCVLAFGALAVLHGNPFLLALGLPSLAGMEFFLREL
jgi:hypothetical protein